MCLLLAKADLSDIVYADHIPEGRGTWVFFFFFFSLGNLKDRVATTEILSNIKHEICAILIP